MAKMQLVSEDGTKYILHEGGRIETDSGTYYQDGTLAAPCTECTCWE